jgi:hypothetical protein
MTNDASQGRPPARTRDWERLALQRVAALHGELRHTRSNHTEQSPRDWERHALETLRRYFRTQR